MSKTRGSVEPQGPAENDTVTQTGARSEADPRSVAAGDTWLAAATEPDTEPHERTAESTAGDSDGGPKLGDLTGWSAAELRVAKPDKRYAIEGEIARGGLGRIVKARDHRLARAVALKELIHTSADGVTRFLREAQITAQLEHPSIVPVYDVARWPDGKPFYSMKLVSGQSFEQVVQRTRSVGERIALVPKLVAVVDAIAYAHSHGVVHRDLKPLNVLIGEFGETLVIDWGLAKYLHETDEPAAGPIERATTAPDVTRPALTVVGSVLGTPDFMAPEQARGDVVDARADVYAIGSIIYYALAGGAPYQATEPETVLSAVLDGPPPPLETREPSVPPDLLAIVHKAMARNPDQRYPTARELADDLERFQTGQLVGARRYSRRDLVRRWVRRHRGMLAIAAAAAMVFLGAVATSMYSIAHERDVAQTQRVRADQQRGEAVAARAEALERGNKLVLLQAKSQLAEDPTAALAWLKRYPLDGGDWTVVRTLAERATSRGVARAVWRQTYPVTSVATSPDGRYLAVGGRAGGVLLRDLDTGTIRKLPDFDKEVAGLVYAPSGRAIAIAAFDNTVLVWELASDSARVLATHRAAITALEYSPDGRLLMSASLDGSLRVWELAVETYRDLRGHTDQVTSATFAPDGRIVSGSSDGTVRVWQPSAGTHTVIKALGSVTWVGVTPDGRSIAVADMTGRVTIHAESGARKRILTGHSRPIYTGAVSPDGRFLVTGSADETARLWDLRDGSSRAATFDGPVTHVAFSPDAKQVVAVGVDRRVRVLRVHGEDRLLLGHGAPVWSAAFSRDGRWLVTASEDQSVRVWSVAPERGRVIGSSAKALGDVAFSADGTVLAAAGEDGAVGVFDARTDEWLRLLARADTPAIRGIGVAPDGSYIAALHVDGVVRVWRRAVDGWVDEVVGRHQSPGLAIAVSPRSGAVATASASGAVAVWTPEAGQSRIAPRSAKTDLLRWSADGRVLAIGDHSGAIAVWDPVTNVARDLPGHRNRVRSLEFSPDGRAIVSGGYDGAVRVWRQDGGEPLVLTGHMGPVLTVAFSRDGSRVASAGVDGSVRAWDARSGELVARLPTGGAVIRVLFSPGDRNLVTAGYQGGVQMLELETGATKVLDSSEDSVYAIEFSPDEQILVAAGESGRLRAWDVNSEGDVPGSAPADKLALRRWLARATSAEASDDPTAALRSPTGVALAGPLQD